MRIVHIAYSGNPLRKDPREWLNRISFFTGILEQMANHAEIYHVNFLGYEGSLTKNGVHHFFFKRNRFQLLLPLSINLFIRSLGSDIIFIHGLRTPWHTLLLRFFLKRKTRIVIQHHAERPLKGINKLLQKIADRYVDMYFFTALDLAIAWVKQGQIRNTTKIREVMEVSSVFSVIDKKIALEKTAVQVGNVFLWVGRLDANKDPVTTVNAFLKFLATGGIGTLCMIFQTEELLDELRSIINANPALSDKIKLVGRIDHDDLLYWYNSADFILSTSHYEGSGVAVCEAMSCGCIPILSDIASFKMITSGKCGFLFPPGNVNRLTELLHNTKDLNILEEREKTLKQFQEQLSFHAISKKIYEDLRSL